MTLLTHTGGPFEPGSYSSAKRELTGAATAHLPIIKRICQTAAVFLLLLSVVGGAIALKTAAFLSRLTY